MCSYMHEWFCLNLAVISRQSEMQQNLDENDVSGFVDSVQMALAVDADLDAHYGKETGYKTILHLALEEDDGEPYVEELLRVTF